MSSGCTITDPKALYFCTFTMVQWADIFSRKHYRDLVAESMNFCIAHKGLNVHAYVFMTHHIHSILSASNGNLSGIIRDLKSFTAKQIYTHIQQGPESRSQWLELICQFAAGGHNRNKDFQIWQHDNHPEQLYSKNFILQKLDYVHNNPVKAGWVVEPQHWLYSSAADYAAGRQLGLVQTSLLDLW